MEVYGRWAKVLFSCSTLFSATAATAGEQDRTLLLQSGKATVRWHAQLGLNLVAERNLFWNLSDTIAPQAGFDPDALWLEGYVKPGLSFEYAGSEADVYGRASAVSSFTRGTDAFDATDSSATTLEEAYLGLRAPGEEPRWDVSLGPRELKLGSGMLIANGGSSGFERGALKFGPRKAWKQAAIARLRIDRAVATAFRIAPNEMPSNEGNNRLAGVDLRWESPSDSYIGATYIHVLNSQSPYVQAAPGGLGPPTILPGGRHGTKAVNLYFRAAPDSGPLRDWFFAGDYARESNKRIDLQAWGGRAQAGYRFRERRWDPWLADLQVVLRR